MRLLRWLAREFCDIFGLDTPIWALPRIGDMKDLNEY